MNWPEMESYHEPRTASAKAEGRSPKAEGRPNSEIRMVLGKVPAVVCL